MPPKNISELEPVTVYVSAIPDRETKNIDIAFKADSLKHRLMKYPHMNPKFKFEVTIQTTELYSDEEIENIKQYLQLTLKNQFLAFVEVERRKNIDGQITKKICLPGAKN